MFQSQVLESRPSMPTMWPQYRTRQWWSRSHRHAAELIGLVDEPIHGAARDWACNRRRDECCAFKWYRESDHIRILIYSMLSGGSKRRMSIGWARMTH